ncbi:MAG: ribosome silencing factor [Acholeplasmatales bacterium]|nr:MAG: ribosome silencing factor [Acholeplasmatales bacterium]
MKLLPEGRRLILAKIHVVIEALEDLKLQDILIYDMRERSPFFEYFILSTATNVRQLQAAVKHLKDHLSAASLEQPVIEGAQSNAWVLMDAKDIVVNIFTKEERLYYNIEKMWMDVPTIDPKDA